VDTYAYFGEPVFTYSLKDGINDGFLTPFRVRQIATTLDDYVYTPDDTLIEGEIEGGRRYEEADFNRIIEIREREKKRVEIFMGEIDQREKTIVFCATQTHALVVRDLINQMKSSSDPGYCERVTANDGALGEEHLRNFQDNEKTIPTILTTSQKLSTGVDARNVRNIVLMRPVNSMIEFKQIIGRGTRLYDGKDYFTIYDFVRAHHHFSDPEWDGEPIAPEPAGATHVAREPEPDAPYDPNRVADGGEDAVRRRTVRVKLSDGKARTIQHMMCTSFWHPDGTPMSAQQFMEMLFGKLPEFFRDEDELRLIWSDPETRRKLLEGLSEKGFGRDQLLEMQTLINAEKSDLFDVLSYVAFLADPESRADRAAVARTHAVSQFTEMQSAFVNFVLDQYETQGVDELDTNKLVPLLKLRYGDAISQAIHDLGDVATLRKVFVAFQPALYAARA
jgi:type I restriction enzyme R subunit